jgi:hypothetical protein
MAFRFNQASTRSIAAFTEDYRVVPTATGCNLTWVMAMKPNGVAGATWHVARPAGDGANVPEVSVQPARRYEQRYATTA